MLKKIIYLNAGHHHLDPGASGNGLIERDEVIKIRDLLIPKLEEYFEVYVCPDNLRLQDSVRWVNGLAKGINDGLALSLHMNAGRGEGAECFYYDYSIKGRSMAKKLLNSYCDTTRLNNRGAKPDRKSANKYLWWVKNTNPWALLLETCFIDNKKDTDYFRTHKEQIAEGIYQGILAIYNIKEKAEIKKKIIQNLTNSLKLVDQLC